MEGSAPILIAYDGSPSADHAIREAGGLLARRRALAVAEDADTLVAETIVTVAREQGAAAIVVGAHGHSRLSEVVLGSTSRDVIRRAPCPVVVARPMTER